MIRDVSDPTYAILSWHTRPKHNTQKSVSFRVLTPKYGHIHIGLEYVFFFEAPEHLSLVEVVKIGSLVDMGWVKLTEIILSALVSLERCRDLVPMLVNIQ